MQTPKKIFACALALLPFLETAAFAQKDCLKPGMAVEALGQTAARSLDDFVGRALLVKVVHPDQDCIEGLGILAVRKCARCEQHTAAMNLLHRRFRAEGLTVLGVGAERDGVLERWAGQYRVEHAWASDPDGELLALVAPQGGCGAALIDAAGRVVWRGEPAALKPETLLPVLRCAFPVPMEEWGAAQEATRSALRHGQLVQALERAGGIPDQRGGAAIRATIGHLIDARIELFGEAGKAGDLLGERERGRELLKALAGDARRDAVEARLAAAKDEPMAAKILAAQREVRECRTLRITRRKDRERAIATLDRICRELPGTHAAWEARLLLAQIKRRMVEAKIKE